MPYEDFDMMISDCKWFALERRAELQQKDTGDSIANLM